MRVIKRVFWIAIFALVVIFAVINRNSTVEVVIDPLGLGYEVLRPYIMPLPFVIIIALGVGLIVGVMLENDRGRAIRRELRKEQQRRSEAETDLRRAHEAMRAADHPDSAGLPVARR